MHPHARQTEQVSDIKKSLRIKGFDGWGSPCA